MNWPLWGGLLAMLLLAKHVWVLFAPAEHAVPGTTVTAQSAQAEQLFGTVSAGAAAAPLSGIRPIGIFASSKNGFAVMQTETGQVGVGLGGQVVPGVRLVETHSDYVMLERNGVRQRADLDKTHVAVDGGAQFRSTPAPAAPAVAPAAPVPPAPAAAGSAAPNAPAGSSRAPNQFNPEQRKILEQQQREMKRSKH